MIKGVNDQTLAYSTTTKSFTTDEVIVDGLTQYQAYIRKFRIVNDDNTNDLVYRQGSKSGLLKTLPVLSEVSVEGWESYIEVVPNSSTGLGYLEMDLVLKTSALK